MGHFRLKPDEFDRLVDCIHAEEPGPNGADLGRIDKYALRRVIGRGGMGIVYEAEDSELKRTVALKVIREIESDPDAIQRLRREAAAMAQFRHPHIVPVYEVGDGVDPQGVRVHYIAMAYIEGRTFAEVLVDPTIGRGERLRMIEDVARAVAHAHSKSVIHRDLKPSNVLVESGGHVLLTDFGLAFGNRFATKLTQAGVVMGTPVYMAPEQVRGKSQEIDARTDVYALGVMLYEILTGGLPFPDEEAESLFQRILNDEPTRPSRHVPDLPRELEVVCLKAMEKEKSRRYAGALEFAEELERVRNGEAIWARPPSFVYRCRKWIVRRKALVAAALAGAILLGIAVPWIVRDRRARTRERRITALWKQVSVLESEADTYLRIGRHDLGVEKQQKGIAICRDFLQDEESADAHFFIARLLYLFDDHDAADGELEAALRAQPDFGDARLLRGLVGVLRYGNCALALLPHWSEDPDEFDRQFPDLRDLRERAIRDLSEVSGPLSYVSDVDRVFARSQLLRLRGETEAARKGMEEVLTLNPLYSRALIPSAEIALRERDWNRALDLASRLQREHRSYGWNALLLMSRAYREMAEEAREVSKAEELRRRSLQYAEKAVSWNPERIDARSVLAGVRLESNDIDGAIEEYTRILQVSPKESRAYHGRAIARRKKGDAAGAEEDVNRALALSPQYAGAYHTRGLIRNARGDARGALLDLDQALRFTSRDAELYYNRGNLRRKLGDGDGAIADYDEAIRLRPRWAKPYCNRGMARRAKNDIDGAIADYNAALAIDPGLVQAYVNRADAKKRTDPADALVDLDQALALQPECAEAHVSRGLILWSEQDGRMEDDFNQAVEHGPRLALARYVRGKFRVGRKDLDGALSDFSAAIDLNPKEADAYYQRGKIRREKGDRAGARQDFEDALRTAPADWKERAAAQKELDEVR